MAAGATAEQHREAIASEWGQYLAIAPIDVGGGRAFNPGDPVPVSHVDKGIVRADQVEKVAPPKKIEKG